MKTQAIMKIEEGLQRYKGDKYGGVMKHYIAGVLKDFCRQKEEFAQAVVQGGSFQACMGAVVCAVQQQAISDLDACRAAAEFYFPGSVVKFQMTIRMSRFEAREEREEEEKLELRLEDFL